MRFAWLKSRHWWAVHLRWWGGDTRLLLRRTFAEYSDDHCAALAASISYYVFFSIFPLAILFVSISGLVLTNDSVRAGVVDDIFDFLPLSEDEGRADLETAIDGVATSLSIIGLVSVFGLLWAASGMMGSLRHALNQAWDIDFRRPFLRGKFFDLLMVMGAGGLIMLSIASTIFLQVARRVSDGVADFLGPLGAGTAFSFELFAVVVPFLFSLATFMFIFKIIPNVRTRFRDIWPGALLSALLFELVKNGFAVYLRYFGDYDAVYGSLGAVIAFLFFIYISASIVLLGAEMAAEWPRVMHGHYDKSLAPAAVGPSAPLRRRVKTGLAGLIRHTEEMPEHIADTSRGDARRQRRADLVDARRRAADAGESVDNGEIDDSVDSADAASEPTASAPPDPEPDVEPDPSDPADPRSGAAP